MTDGVVAFDRDGQVIHSNPAAEGMLGRPIGPDTTYKELFGDQYSLEEAMAALGEVTGRTVREDITNRIFERFCVGK